MLFWTNTVITLYGLHIMLTCSGIWIKNRPILSCLILKWRYRLHHAVSRGAYFCWFMNQFQRPRNWNIMICHSHKFFLRLQCKTRFGYGHTNPKLTAECLRTPLNAFHCEPILILLYINFPAIYKELYAYGM